ncbi:hypothetical protein KUTeg_003623 [Tegillarca granosa]|uniref:Uncharacterized protein n=1 Tax=Tegillarca granosa TaxID=220873 RepID=A0ABQ9FML9_TEGGR|nr:hypothetical protein KUTeg_003623 [Tegillarca granosa]
MFRIEERKVGYGLRWTADASGTVLHCIQDSKQPPLCNTVILRNFRSQVEIKFRALLISMRYLYMQQIVLSNEELDAMLNNLNFINCHETLGNADDVSVMSSG